MQNAKCKMQNAGEGALRPPDCKVRNEGKFYMLNASEAITLTYRGKEFSYSNAHICHTEEKSVLEDGLVIKNVLKVRVPWGGAEAPPVGARTVFKSKVYTVLLARENFKGKNPHIYLLLQS